MGSRMLVKFLKSAALAVTFLAAGASAAFSASLQCDTAIAETPTAAVGTQTVTALKKATMDSSWIGTGGGCEIFDVDDSTGTLGDRQTAAITVSRPQNNRTRWVCEAKSDPGRVEPYKLRAIAIFCRVND